MAHRLCMRRDVLCKVQHVSENHLRNGRRGVGRYVCDRHATSTGCSEVDDVVAGGQHTDVFEIGQAADVPGIEHGLVGEHDLGIGSSIGD